MSQSAFDWSLFNAVAGKQAMTPPTDPAAGGAPPMDPAMMAGTPGGAATMPGMPPAQLPPMDPAAAGGGMMPGMDPSMMGMGGMPPGGGDPSMMMAGGQPGAGGPAAGGKLKPEQMFQIISLRLFNIEQQLAEALRGQGKALDPGAMIQPPDATMAGAPKPPEAGGDPNASPEQQKAASELYQLHQLRNTLQNQAPENYDVILVRRYPDAVKAAADRTNLIAEYLFGEKVAGAEGDIDDAAYEAAMSDDEYDQESLLNFGAKAAEDHLRQFGVQKTAEQPETFSYGDILGTPSVGILDTLVTAPAAAPAPRVQPEPSLANILGLQ